MSVKSVSLNDVVVGDVPTHIVIYRDSANMSLAKKVEELTAELERMSKRVLHMELAAEDEAKAKVKAKSSDAATITEVEEVEEVKTTPFFSASVDPEPTGLHVRRLSDMGAELTDHSKTTLKAIINGLVPPANASRVNIVQDSMEEGTEAEADEVEAEAETDEVEPDEAEEEAEAEVEEEAEAEEEEQEQEAEELCEFEYKGVTYYRDSENLVYKLDDDGDLDDTPIGIWNEEKQKILKYKV